MVFARIGTAATSPPSLEKALRWMPCLIWILSFMSATVSDSPAHHEGNRLAREEVHKDAMVGICSCHNTNTE